MNQAFIEEFQRMSHEDEMRPKVLIRGIKQILNEKKKAHVLRKLLNRKPKIEPSSW
ncbi:hypothetical protein [Paenibacillus planticolens]|uniref:hypothetical protein n=1 Tax=Paenibacillus planticolens TaxID=2654976 RepID=UPI001490FD88|nr:hypothetical protein [Paenibacillus planticolens]